MVTKRKKAKKAVKKAARKPATKVAKKKVAKKAAKKVAKKKAAKKAAPAPVPRKVESFVGKPAPAIHATARSDQWRHARPPRSPPAYPGPRALGGSSGLLAGQ